MISANTLLRSSYAATALRPEPAYDVGRALEAPRHIVVGVSDPHSSGLTQLLLEEQGWSVIVLDIFTWLLGNDGPCRRPDVVLLEAWSLRDPALARRARERLAAYGAPLVLLTEDDCDLTLSHELGAAVTLPLLFNFDELVWALRQALRAPVLERDGRRR